MDPLVPQNVTRTCPSEAARDCRDRSYSSALIIVIYPLGEIVPLSPRPTGLRRRPLFDPPRVNRRAFLGLLAGGLAAACGLPPGARDQGSARTSAGSQPGEILVAVAGEPRSLVPSVAGMPG